MKNNIFIPNKIKVGFQQRDDTYTKTLAYIIYLDQKNKLRKEDSWNSWRDKRIEPKEFDNAPTSGFVLNKKAGGYNSGWNHRQTYCRVYDPRDFEFEITIPNLLYILENTNSIKGKGLEGEFVYGWDGKDLILIPILSPDYKEISEFSNTINKNDFIKAKDLIVGATYQTKQNEILVFMGYSDVYDYEYHNCKPSIDIRSKEAVKKGKGYFFYDINYKNKKEKWHTAPPFRYYRTIKDKIIAIIDDSCIENYAKIYEELESDDTYSRVDNSKDIIIPYSFEEFMEELKKKTNYYYNSFKNKNKERFGNINKINDKYKCVCFDKFEKSYWSLNNKYKEYNDLSAEELFNIIEPVHLDKYFESGKFFEREY